MRAIAGPIVRSTDLGGKRLGAAPRIIRVVFRNRFRAAMSGTFYADPRKKLQNTARYRLAKKKPAAHQIPSTQRWPSRGRLLA